jgi:hypothetical protein
MHFAAPANHEMGCLCSLALENTVGCCRSLQRKDTIPYQIHGQELFS